MSVVKAKNIQIGSSLTESNNFTIRQPLSPDGSIRVSIGNAGTTTDVVKIDNTGTTSVYGSFYVIEGGDGIRFYLDGTKFVIAGWGLPLKAEAGSVTVENWDSDKLDAQEGSYYLDHTNFTNVPDPTLTLSGDVTGSATFTNLGNATLTASVPEAAVTQHEAALDKYTQTQVNNLINTVTNDSLAFSIALG